MSGGEPTRTATDRAWRAINVARGLALDVVEAKGNGHAGTAMSLAPLAHLLFQEVMRHDPADPDWAGRDRFVLSAGHAALLLYVQLHLTGYGLTLDDLRRTRRLGSATPGHPEYRHTAGVEMTTGPLGQGLATAVGMAMAARHERATFDPGSEPGRSPFDHTVWVVASDGDLQEGVSSEASSLAGTLGLDNLVVIWDDNGISIDGPTDLSFTEDVRARYRAYGWHVEDVADGDDLDALRAALTRARELPDRPVLIALRTVIGAPAPNRGGTAAAHAGPFGADEAAATKALLGLDPESSFQVPDDVLADTRSAAARGARLRAEWNESLDRWRTRHPDRAAERYRLLARAAEGGWPLPEPADKPQATRVANGAVLAALAATPAGLWGGSADLSESTGVARPEAIPFSAAAPDGTALHFGIREHAMAAIAAGIALHGTYRPYVSTYLSFSDYLRPSLRLAALMRLPVVYVFTHDSVTVGEDGPTHQPVEQLWGLRGVPGVDLVRPADAAETIAAWRRLLDRPEGPTALALGRHKAEPLDHSGHDVDAGVARGGYVLAEAEGGRPRVLLLATGTEVALAVAAQRELHGRGVPARVVSLPCLEWFEEQPAAYRDAVLPPEVRARVSVEAGSGQGWWRYLGLTGETVAVDRFGLSGPGEEVLAELGVTASAVVAAALRSLARTEAEAPAATR
ncbi:transketolase [Allonocardiopsis opalescens]|uniref:Transketolase n=1 Tax=Allonocardiopsis opalescens TaxID=1144618 RepID=A0A2T0Q9M3_9ACTN|nr:transketolase [Allonocardiopsis opalescens]PRY00596.1 transketolase [Allonocardiopsis opalescens]